MSQDALRISRPLSVIAVLAVAWAPSGVTLRQQAAGITLNPGSGLTGINVKVSGSGFLSNQSGRSKLEQQTQAAPLERGDLDQVAVVQDERLHRVVGRCRMLLNHIGWESALGHGSFLLDSETDWVTLFGNDLRGLATS